MLDSYFINIDKPCGITSFDVVFRLRKILGEKKIGHLGTLDPFATGVLPVAVNKGTRLIQYLQDGEKEYIADLMFGAVSSTYDLTGEIVPVVGNLDDFVFTEADIDNKLAEFVGFVDQVPPRVSALKVDGKRAYDLARMGAIFELKPRKVNLFSVEILAYAWPKLQIRVVCGKGYYVRSLAHDLGQKLGVGAYLTGLKRTRVGIFDQTNLFKLEDLERHKSADVYKIKMIQALGNFPRYILSEADFSELKFGRFIENSQTVSGQFGEVFAGVLTDSAGEARLVCLLESLPDSRIKMKCIL